MRTIAASAEVAAAAAARIGVNASRGAVSPPARSAAAASASSAAAGTSGASAPRCPGWAAILRKYGEPRAPTGAETRSR